jgi:hypothetical protein
MAGMTYGGFFTGNFHGTCMRLGNPWDLKGYRQKHGEPLRDYIRCFSQKYHKLPGVADADFISTFWYGTTCHSLVHELDCEQPRTTKELIDIATQHTSGEVAVGATFTLVNAPKRVLRVGKRGKNANRIAWLLWPVTDTSRRKSMTPVRSSWWLPNETSNSALDHPETTS